MRWTKDPRVRAVEARLPAAVCLMVDGAQVRQPLSQILADGFQFDVFLADAPCQAELEQLQASGAALLIANGGVSVYRKQD